MTRTAIALLTLGVFFVASCSDAAAPDVTTTAAGSSNDTSTTSTAADEVPTSTTATTQPQTTTTTEPSTTSTLGVQVFSFVVNDGEVDGPDRIEVVRGSTVNLILTGNTTDEVHLHGYDLFVDIDPQSAAIIEFVADIAGIFEVELETAGLLVTEVVVR